MAFRHGDNENTSSLPERHPSSHQQQQATNHFPPPPPPPPVRVTTPAPTRIPSSQEIIATEQNKKSTPSAPAVTAANLYLQSLQRPISPNIKGLLYWYRDNRDDDHHNNESLPINRIYKAFQTCQKYQPNAFIENPAKEEKSIGPKHQRELTHQKSAEVMASSSSNDHGNHFMFPLDTTSTTLERDNEMKKNKKRDQYMQLQRKVIEALQEKERKYQYIDCISYHVCPTLFQQYTSCWFRHIQQLKYQQQLQLQYYYQQHQYQNQPYKQKPNSKNQENQLITKQWKQWKESGKLYQICSWERDQIERCISSTIIKANDETYAIRKK